MEFIDRKQELARLNRLATSSESAIAVVWGRRRIGKTRLLLEWARQQKAVYFTADESASSVQRKYFSLVLEQVLPGFSAVEYPDWTTLLTRLAREAVQTGWKGPLIIDELPYLIATTPEFPSIFQRFIDHDARQAKLILVLCGSSQRMMQGAILDASAPLYGRAQEILKLGPISIGYMEEALGIQDVREIVQSYAIWGGIPRYWELVVNSAPSLLEKVEHLILDPMGPLNDEPNRLLLGEIPSAISLRPILDAIGLGSHRLSEIAGRVGQPATSLNRPIQRLIELDLIEREVPYGVDPHNSKRTLYKIKDPFLRFWFEIVASRRSFLAQTSSKNRLKWLQTILQDNLQTLFAYEWEELCRQALPALWDDLFFGKAGRYWQGAGPEWDILAETLDRGVLCVGEAKWISGTPTQKWIQQTIQQVQAKGNPPIRCPKILTVLFIPEKPKRLPSQEWVRVVDAKEVIAALM